MLHSIPYNNVDHTRAHVMTGIAGAAIGAAGQTLLVCVCVCVWFRLPKFPPSPRPPADVPVWSCREFVFFNRKNSRPLARELEAGEEKNYALHFDAYIVYVSTSRSLLTSLNLDMCGYGNTPDGLYTMCCLLVLDSVTSTPQWIRQPRPRVYLQEGTYHTRLFRGPSTNDMKK